MPCVEAWWPEPKPSPAGIIIFFFIKKFSLFLFSEYLKGPIFIGCKGWEYFLYISSILTFFKKTLLGLTL